MPQSSRFLLVIQVLFLGALLALTGCPDGDPCDGVDCDPGEVCDDGACVPIEETCTPLECHDIAANACGTHDDGCDGTINCGECEGDLECEDGFCIDPTCDPDCTDLECGPDPVCGRSCGTCEDGWDCEEGVCVCDPDCTGLECGPDPICGESCGTCEDGWDCEEGFCIDPSCDPDCTGLECGPDPICNESCGTCEDGWGCEEGVCVCVPDCTGLDCGPDPVCGQSCGTCEDDWDCEQGVCVCVPDCTGLECGPDPICGESCGTCEDDWDCEEGVCLPDCGDQFSPNHTMATAAALTLPFTRTDLTLCGPNAEDWFSFTLDGGNIYSIAIYFTHADGDIDMRLTDDDGNTVRSAASSTDDELIEYAVPFDATGTYYLRVYHWDTHILEQPYELEILQTASVECFNTDDCGDSELCIDHECIIVECIETDDCDANEMCIDNECVVCEPDDYAGNDTWETAAAIDLPFDETDLTLCGGGAEDWFEFDLDAEQVYSFTALFTHGDGNIDMRLFKDPEGTAVASGTSWTDNEEFAYVVPENEGGTYYLRVSLSTFADMNSYDLIIEDLGTAECEEHADCPSLGEVCQHYICMMSECTATEDCEGYGLVCAAGADYCVECNIVDDCPNAEDFECVNNVCELDCDPDQYAGNHSHETAAAVTLPFNETGLTLCGRRAEDWFSFSLSPGDEVTVEALFTHADGDVDIYLRHEDNPTTSLALGTSMTDNETMNYTVPADGGGTYYVRVYLYSSYTQTYDLNISVQ